MKPKTNKKSPIIIGVSGGSGSGKTTICEAVATRFPADISIITLDAYYLNSYYADRMALSNSKDPQVNFDCPEAIDNDLLVRHLNALKNTRPVGIPDYDFTTHSRTGKIRKMHPTRIILLEGIMVFALPDIKNLCDFKVYIHVEPDIRLIRRIKRDIHSRGRSVDSVINQYLNTVKPMHNKYVSPHKNQADLIIDELESHMAADTLSAFIRDVVLTAINGGAYES